MKEVYMFNSNLTSIEKSKLSTGEINELNKQFQGIFYYSVYSSNLAKIIYYYVPVENINKFIECYANGKMKSQIKQYLITENRNIKINSLLNE